MNKPFDNRKSLRNLSSAAFLAGCVLSFGQAAAGNLVVGLGGEFSTAEYEGVDSEVNAIPVISYEIGRFTLGFGTATVRMASFSSAPLTDPDTGNQESDYNLHLLATASFADDERDNGDSPMFTGMDTREYGSIAGVSAILEVPFGMFGVSYLADVSDSSDGSFTSLTYGVPLYGSQRVSVNGSIGANIFDGNWNDYYYGVRASEATDNRAAYQADQSVSPFVELDASYAFNSHWVVSQSAIVTFLDDTVIDSPLTVDDDTHAEYVINMLYIF